MKNSNQLISRVYIANNRPYMLTSNWVFVRKCTSVLQLTVVSGIHKLVDIYNSYTIIDFALGYSQSDVVL